MEEELAVWAAALELETLRTREETLTAFSQIKASTSDLTDQLDSINTSIAKLKHMTKTNDSFIKEQVEKNVQEALEDIDIRLERNTIKIRSVVNDINLLQRQLNDTEDLIHSLVRRVTALERGNSLHKEQKQQQPKQRPINIRVQKPKQQHREYRTRTLI